MELKVSEWKEFKVNRIFLCETTILSIKDILDEGSVPFISRTAENNGCDGYVDVSADAITKGHCLTVGAEGVYCFYQPVDFATGNKVYTLRNTDLTMNQYLFIATILNQEDYKYNYGRARIKSKLENEILRLPIQHNAAGQPVIDQSRKYSDDGYVPDWDFMEQYMKSLNTQPLVTQRGGSASPTLGVERWKAFRLDRLFVLKGGFYNKKPEHSVDGRVPFLGSTENDNGVTEFYSLDDIRSWNKVGLPDDSLDGKLFDGGCVAVTVNGSVCNAFYQAEQFTCSHDITALYVPHMFMTEFVGLFIASVIMKDKYRWNYGRKPHSIEKFGKSFISLPVQHDAAGQPVIDPSRKYSDDGYIPDWAFMEQYIGSLPGSDLI